MNTTNLTSSCYYIQDGEVVEGLLSDLDMLIETTTRPDGVGPKYYVTRAPRRVEAVYNDDGEEIEPARTEHVWALAKWATYSGPEVIVDTFDNESEAQAAAEATYVHDILNNAEMSVHLDRDGAEDELRMLQEEAAE